MPFPALLNLTLINGAFWHRTLYCSILMKLFVLFLLSLVYALGKEFYFYDCLILHSYFVSRFGMTMFPTLNWLNTRRIKIGSENMVTIFFSLAVELNLKME